MTFNQKQDIMMGMTNKNSDGMKRTWFITVYCIMSPSSIAQITVTKARPLEGVRDGAPLTLLGLVPPSGS